MGTTVSLNGQLLDKEHARVSVFDRGFLYGDSVYEVLRTYSGVPFELGAHLRRLNESANRIGMQLPRSEDKIGEEVLRVHVASENPESYIRIVCTRGSGPINLDPMVAEEPLLVAMAQPVNPPPPKTYQEGASVALVSVRRNLRSAIDPRAKTGNYLNSVLALQEARARGAYEAVMLSHRDLVTEGASSNIFAVLGETILTPPLESGILKGITREVVFKIAEKGGFKAIEMPLTEDALKKADEVFITSSIREIVPIVLVDETQIGQGRPGRVVTRLRELYQDYIKSYVAAHS